MAAKSPRRTTFAVPTIELPNFLFGSSFCLAFWAEINAGTIGLTVSESKPHILSPVNFRSSATKTGQAPDLIQIVRPLSIDQAGDKTRAEAVVDIYNRYVRRAGVEHSQQRRDTAEGRAITNTRRHRDDWHTH